MYLVGLTFLNSMTGVLLTADFFNSLGLKMANEVVAVEVAGEVVAVKVIAALVVVVAVEVANEVVVAKVVAVEVAVEMAG
jgi:hypothetical protein